MTWGVNAHFRHYPSLILLDINFEIALKEFVVHRTDLFPPREFDNAAIQKLFERRGDVIKVVTSKIAISKTLIDKASTTTARGTS